ncbi:hypothetical protein [Planococcus antarcticus]|uniref:hypothetical protein n=1 Tax=Planococcus antarcticus TaxID=161360 RepID=UPI0012B60143|nr:hypothetical protein [Planococcus antarcticus]
MNNSHFSAVERIETMLTEVSFLKLILVVVPVSMAGTLLYAVSSDFFATLTYTFFR